MEAKCADETTQLEIDEMILDYLVFTATRYVLEDYELHLQNPAHNESSNRSSTLLQLVDSFLSMFRAMHPKQHSHLDFQFRLRLLKLSTLLTRRLTTTETTPRPKKLGKVRRKRRDESRCFRSNQTDFTRLDLPDLDQHLSPLDLYQNEYGLVDQERKLLSDEHSARVTKGPPSVSLLEILPHFMALSAAQNTMQETTITDIWMNLAAGFMAQAVMEQYLVYAASDSGLLQEAFAWGFDAKCRAEEGSDEWQINAMFWGEDGAVIGWDRIRDDHLHALVPPPKIDLRQHFQSLIAGEFSLARFEDCMLDFLSGLHRSQPRPLLNQVESGRVDGMSQKQLRALHDILSMT